MAEHLSLENYFCTVYSVTFQSPERSWLPRRSGNVRFIGMGNPCAQCPPRNHHQDPVSNAAAGRAPRTAAHERQDRLVRQIQMRKNRRCQNEEPPRQNESEDQMREQRK